MHLRTWEDVSRVAIFCSTPEECASLAEAIAASATDCTHVIVKSIQHPPLEETLALAPQIADDPRYVLPTHALDGRDNRRDNSDSNAMEIDDDTPF
jgi:hypothetical protein